MVLVMFVVHFVSAAALSSPAKSHIMDQKPTKQADPGIPQTLGACQPYKRNGRKPPL